MTTDAPEASRKALIDALLLKLPGVSAGKINSLDAYFVGERMFACISGNGIGLRLPVATATDLQFSRADVVPFKPGGMAVSREWRRRCCESPGSACTTTRRPWRARSGRSGGFSCCCLACFSSPPRRA